MITEIQHNAMPAYHTALTFAHMVLALYPQPDITQLPPDKSPTIKIDDRTDNQCGFQVIISVDRDAGMEFSNQVAVYCRDLTSRDVVVFFQRIYTPTNKDRIPTSTTLSNMQVPIDNELFAMINTARLSVKYLKTNSPEVLFTI